MCIYIYIYKLYNVYRKEGNIIGNIKEEMLGGQKKIYDRVCSLNQFINCFFAIFFFSTYIQTILF